ncbi:MAG: ABC-2 family transporter protein [Anaerolineales bacterium]|nr:ABC-2 family transporter protein [Anaerolineales bacterium]
MTEINLRGAWALVRRTWRSWMQHRGFFFLLAFGWMIPPLIYLFVWSTAASGRTVGGLNRDEFVVYYLVLMLVNQLTYAQTNWTVGDLIRMGSMNVLLLRPLKPIFDALASEIAGKVVMMAFVIPATGALALVLRPEVRFRPSNVLLFSLALALAWALRFFWGYWLALLAFWTARADSLLALQDALVFLLAGQAAPTALLPPSLQALAAALPFRYMLGFPVEVLTGQVQGGELWAGFGLQALWLGIALALYAGLWRNGLRHYSAAGG